MNPDESMDTNNRDDTDEARIVAAQTTRWCAQP